MKSFYQLLGNNLIAGLTNMFVWFAYTFWVYLETRSVLATAILGGSWALLSSLSSLLFGTYVDHNKKKKAMFISTVISFFAFLCGVIFSFSISKELLLDLNNIYFWIFTIILAIGTIAGNMRNIALSTCVTIMVPEEKHANANGMIGSVTGVMFAFTSVFSGLGIGFLGMSWVLVISTVLSVLVILHLMIIKIEEKEIVHLEEKPSVIDFKTAFKEVLLIEGLLGLIILTTFNNFLGGVFMSMMDAYGLSLVSVQVWGVMWAVLSTGFIIGGLVIAKYGLGKNPLKTMLMINSLLWTICIFFTIRESIILTAVGLFLYMCLMPMVEASEQTIIQKVIPADKQGRVFGFAHAVEQAASPIAAFLVGPLAEFIVIPFVNSVQGKEIFTPILGAGDSRGIALIFTLAGVLGLIATIWALNSKTYKFLSKSYLGK